MPKYKVWRSYEEQWDANNIDPPDLEVDARSPQGAAEQFAERKAYDDEVACVVQDENGDYFEVELIKKWEVDMYRQTTLEKLCAP